jgi:NAD(P)-dependent dehydrogenase (short-subunit alcohol dehydrogenase family)
VSLLSGRSGIVTGAGRGIGRSVALVLAREGANVVVNDFGVGVDGSTPSSQAADEVIREITEAGGQAVASAESVSSWAGAEKIVQTCIDQFGRIDFLVMCAGILRDRMVFNMSEEEWDAVIATHLKGTFNCGHFASIAMRQQRSGVIVNFTSHAHQGNAGQSNYSAAKGGIASMTYTWAVELGKYGIRVNAIAPIAQTRMLATIPGAPPAGEQPPSSTMPANPDEIANVVAYLISDDTAGVTGQIFGVSNHKITLWEHPRETISAISEAGWSLDRVRGSFMEFFGDQLKPYGILETQYHAPADTAR